VAAVRRDLKDRKPGWLRVAAEAMTTTVLEDFAAWKAVVTA
jgi:hypothetical protein